MATLVFAGYVDTNFANGANWNPAGPPQTGDDAAIGMANAIVTGSLPANLTLSVTTQRFAGRYGNLLLQDTLIPFGTIIDSYTFNDTYDGSLPASLSFVGSIDNKGTVIFSGGVQTIMLPTGTTLLNEGVLDINDAAPDFSAGGPGVTFVNNGLIRVVNPADRAGQLAQFGLAIGGVGTISVSADASLEIGMPVSNGQLLAFTGGVGAGSTVKLNTSTVFSGTISGFLAGDTLLLSNTTATSATYVPNDATSGTLQISNAGVPVASLALSGQYATGEFTLTQSGSSLAVTTSVTDALTGSTSTSTARGVFRFFDKADGSHFLTASITERDTVLVSRPDLVEETNGFGSIASADAETVPIYRFFDTVHGTHFFTPSATERDAVIATRPDLTFEPSGTFLEHMTPQIGDVAVYRLFSTTDGTHLYTASMSELNGLTIPGGTTYRSDLVAEGVSFYAPAGNFS